MMAKEKYLLTPIGFVESELKSKNDAPKQGLEGAPDAGLQLSDDVSNGIQGIVVGDQMILITWLHESKRDVLRVHPRDDFRNALTGVFATRSADRPNPLGLHEVTVKEITGNRIKVGPLEAIDRTPILDIKPIIR